MKRILYVLHTHWTFDVWVDLCAQETWLLFDVQQGLVSFLDLTRFPALRLPPSNAESIRMFFFSRKIANWDIEQIVYMHWTNCVCGRTRIWYLLESATWAYRFMVHRSPVAAIVNIPNQHALFLSPSLSVVQSMEVYEYEYTTSLNHIYNFVFQCT